MPKSSESLQNYNEFLYDLYVKGAPLSDDQIGLLKASGYIKNPDDKKIWTQNVARRYTKSTRRQFKVANHKEVEINETIEIVKDKEVIRQSGTIIKKHWMPDSIIYHKKAFVDWIDSINSGYAKRIPYAKFNLYKQQAEDWYRENDFISNYSEIEQQKNYAYQEIRRIRENSYYFCLKYGWLQEAYMQGGRRRYIAGDDYEHHKIICYLMDCGYSVIMGKPRQIGSTSVLGLIAICKMLTHSNHYLKFITEDEKTGQEIFDDKIKFAFAQLPGWLKPTVLNDRGNLFKVGKKTKSSGDQGINSKIEVVAPSRTAINGGSPQIVFVDEIGSIPILTDMVNEGRPTMYWKDPTTGLLEQKRQIWLWGTGTTGKGGGAYEKEWSRMEGLWNAREFESGIVPIFFDWSTRCSEKEYYSQKKYYYGSRSISENIDSETSRIQFHQHFPSHPRDMFVVTDKILVPRDFLDTNLKKIDNMEDDLKPTYGYFKPIFDFTSPVENSDVPYKIIGAEFVAVGDSDYDKATSIMFQQPKKNWINRYWQGTDPIAADTGTSKMASTVYDKFYNTISCLVNFREPSNPKASFLQCLLMGIYYDCKELVEKNIGLAYFNYVETKGYINRLVLNSELMESFQSGSPSDLGIDNKGARAKFIVAHMHELFTAFGDKIYIDTYFIQLRTFICKLSRSGQSDTWQPLDHRLYFDDALFSAAFAYINALSHINKIPRNIEEERIEVRRKFKTVYDNNYNLVRVPIKEIVRR